MSLAEESVVTRPLPSAPSPIRARFGFVADKLSRSGPMRWKVATLLLALLATGLGIWITVATRTQPQVISYTELLRAIDGGQIEALVVRPGTDVRGVWAATAAEAGTRPDRFVAVFPLLTIDEIAERAQAAGVELTLQPASNPRHLSDLLAIGIQALLFGAIGYLLFVYIRGQKGSGDLGKTGDSQTTFDDVAGTQGAEEELRELVAFLREPASFAAVGARVPKGALLVGPPGTGKTLLARAVAGEAGVPFFSISGSEVTGFVVGLGAHRVKSLFKKARKEGGVIFIDEIDVLGGKRGRNQSHNEDDRTLNQLLVEMDGFSPRDGVVVIGATNRHEDLDPALLRPGRFDRTISVGLPSAQGREEILRLHVGLKGIPLGEDVELARLAQLTPNTSGAELANLLNESAIAAGRDGSPTVCWRHVEQARDRILLGKERIGFRAPQREWQTVAFHEAGHALAGVLCCPEDGLHKVTIQPRGQAMGVAFFSPEDDRNLYRRSYLEGMIIKGLAGRAAEEIVFGDDAITSGAQSDLMQVNNIARKMVYQLGMGQETGLLIHDGEAGSLSAAAHAQMDKEVRQLLERMYERARAVLVANRRALDALAHALLERETLGGADAIRLMEEHGLVRPDFARAPTGPSAAFAQA